MTEEPAPGPPPRFELPEWRARYGVVAGITGRGTGPVPFDLGLAGTTTPAVMARWQSLLGAVPGSIGLAASRQIHGTTFRWHEAVRGLLILDATDGHATATPGVVLAVTAADCVPVYLLDPVDRRVALLHAGWRGTAGRILGQGIALLKARGSRIENLLVHCGIGICGACYEVSSEVFSGCGLTPPNDGKGLLDLRAVLADQARREGIRNVTTSSWCSAHDSTHFFSHRRSGGSDGRMAAYLALER